MKYIVRNWDNKGKYAIKTSNVREAIKLHDELAAQGIRVEIVAKYPGRNDLASVDKFIAEIRETM